MERESGYYWVKVTRHSNKAKWYYNSFRNRWFRDSNCKGGAGLAESSFYKVQPIPEPKEGK